MDNVGGKFTNKNSSKKNKEIMNYEQQNIDQDEEIKQRKQIIVALCSKYNFKYQFVNNNVFIYSIIDEWYFQYTKNNINLFHKNKLNSNNQYHLQKKFKNIVHTIQYIKKHDNFYYKPNSKHKFDIVEKYMNDKNGKLC